MSSDPPFRILPRLDDNNREFWTGGAAGELRFWRCQDCGYYIHPPQPICPIDHSKNLAVEAVSGERRLRATRSTTRTGCPGPELPYVVAIVEIVEQPSVRLTTNLVNCPHDEIRDRHAGAGDRSSTTQIPTATCTSRCSSPERG